MYTYNELREIERQPKINDISLNTLREYYRYYLYPFIYTYTVKDILGDTSSEDYYVPRTFAIERITEKNNGRKFVENQQEIIVEKTSRVIMQ